MSTAWLVLGWLILILTGIYLASAPDVSNGMLGSLLVMCFVWNRVIAQGEKHS